MPDTAEYTLPDTLGFLELTTRLLEEYYQVARNGDFGFLYEYQNRAQFAEKLKSLTEKNKAEWEYFDRGTPETEDDYEGFRIRTTIDIPATLEDLFELLGVQSGNEEDEDIEVDDEQILTHSLWSQDEEDNEPNDVLLSVAVGDEILERGNNGEHTGKIQDALIIFKILTREDIGDDRGSYGPVTEEAVKTFQIQYMEVTNPSDTIKSNTILAMDRALNDGWEYVAIQIYLSWTLDDGPSEHTDDFIACKGESEQFIPKTCFIDKAKSDMNSLKSLQDDGHEIGIHSYNPTETHTAWFPFYYNEDIIQGFDTMDLSMEALKKFTKELHTNDIIVKFVRLTGGLISQLTAYIKHKNKDIKGELAIILARNLIAGGSDILNYTNGDVVADDYNSLLDTLTTLKLHLWRGDWSGPEIRTQSWEVESHRSNEKFQRHLKQTYEDYIDIGKNFSLVILTHDNKEGNLDRMQTDINFMENKARGKGKIVYLTLSDLYRKVRGKEP